MSEPADSSPSGDSVPPPRPPVNPTATSAPPPPAFSPPGYAAPPPMASPRGGRVGRIFGWGVSGILISLLLISVAINVYLGIFVNAVTGGPHEAMFRSGEGQGHIVILPVLGLIDGETNDFVRQSLQAIRRSRPNAVVLRVDSGGGYIGPSDRILFEIKRFKQETNMPIVASFGSLAASGGYYVAAECDWIIAEPTCTTGSIGVMSGAFTIERLLEKLGITPEVRTATGSPEKDVANNLFRQWDERDQAKQMAALDYAYARFVDVVYEGRNVHLKTKEHVQELANGDTYTTAQAIEKKLIDGEGYLYDAIDKAKELAGLPQSDDSQVTMMRPSVRLGVSSFLGMRQPPPRTAEQIKRILLELKMPRLLYR